LLRGRELVLNKRRHFSAPLRFLEETRHSTAAAFRS